MITIIIITITIIIIITIIFVSNSFVNIFFALHDLIISIVFTVMVLNFFYIFLVFRLRIYIGKRKHDLGFFQYKKLI